MRAEGGSGKLQWDFGVDVDGSGGHDGRRFGGGKATSSSDGVEAPVMYANLDAGDVSGSLVFGVCDVPACRQLSTGP